MQSLKFKYRPNIGGIILYYGLLLFNVALLSVKNLPVVQRQLHEVFTHTSNFVITSILMSVISFIWIMQGAPFKFILWLGLVAIVLNFVVELFVTVLNSPDVTDALYGCAGVVVTAIVMLFFKRNCTPQKD